MNPVPDERISLLSHPLRVRLLFELRDGPATAAQLADRTDQTRGNVSYHLRALGAAGLIVDDTQTGTARERWWRLPAMPEVEPTVFDHDADAVPFAVSWCQERERRLTRYAQELTDGALSTDRVAGTRLSEVVLRLGAQDQQALVADLDALLARWEHLALAADPPDDGRVVEVQLSVFAPRDRT